MDDRKIFTRKQWGARAADASRISRENRPVTEAFLHNSDDGNFRVYNTRAKQQKKMREIQRFHMDDRGWADFAYHFAIFQPVGNLRDAHIFRGRENSMVVPAAQLNHNTHTLAIVVIGHGGKDSLKADTQAAIVWLLQQFPTLRTLGGHRDVVATECPGDRFYSRIPHLAHAAGLDPFRG